MDQWYYAHGGQQKGPVSLSDLQRLAASGEFDPQVDLVWNDGMTDWKPGSSVPEIAAFATPPSAETATTTATGATGAGAGAGAGTAAGTAAGTEFNPYAVQGSGLAPVAPEPSQDMQEIVPGSSPIDIGGCISRAFELTKRHFGIIIGTGAVYVGITFGFSFIAGLIEQLMMPGTSGYTEIEPGEFSFETRGSGSPAATAVSAVLQIIGQALSIFLGLGTTRIGLNLVSGRPAEIGMIFGEGAKFWRAVGGAIVYGLMVAVGLILLIVPGIYLALRFGQYQNAIVDKNMGIMDAFRYSSSITENNKMPLLGLAVLSFLIAIAGMLALCVGLIFAYPIIWLSALVAYRWMQLGPTAAMDRPAGFA